MSAELEPQSFVPSMIMGALTSIAGILVVWFRKPLLASILQREDVLLRGRGMTFLRKMQRPWSLGLAGVLMSTFGLLTFIGAVTQLVNVR